VFSAADLIEALSARFRRRFPLLAERAFGEFPPTWRAWFLAIAERPGAVSGVPAGDYVAILSARPPRQPPRASAELGRWPAYRHLLRQQWGPAPADQRRTRRVAAGFSALLHLCFAALLLWVGFVRVGDAPPDTAQAGEAIQVEFIGEGTPVDEGGAPAPGQADAPASAGAGAGQPAAAGGGQQAASAPPPPPFVAAAPPDADTPPQPSPPAEAASAQPLTVTETSAPEPAFTLPQTAVREIALPSLRPQTPSLSTQVVEVETVMPSAATPTLRAPTPRPVASTVPTLRTQVVEIDSFQPTVPVPTLQAPAPRTAAPSVPALRTQITEIEVHSPLATVPSTGIAQAPARTPQLRTQELRTAPGEIALRPGTPGASTSATPSATSSATPGNQAARGTAPTPAATSGSAPAGSTASGGRPQAQGAGRTAGVAPSGAGPRPSTRPGAATSTVRDDDWGASDRNVPGNANAGSGNTAGLFNSDGSVRLPGGAGDVGGGLPPGTIVEDFEKIDRMGTWLKRPPLDYTPTRFDRFWIPNRTLLEEWVQRGIKKVAIPIPGTTKRIECTVSLLSVGGSCRVYDPNLQDQEATARPPPDVPYKPELREDRDGPSAPGTP
jgi:hypothetical protein